MKKKLVSIVLILMMFSFVSVNAQEVKTINFTPNKSEIKKGEEVVLTIESNELTGIEGTVKYDSSLWEVINKTSQNSFTLNENTGKFALANLSGEEKVVAAITFKSREDTTVDSSVIKLSEIKASNKSGQGLDILDKEVNIKFKKETTTNNSQSGTKPTTSPSIEEEYKEIVQVNNNISNQTFPETGKKSGIMVACGLAMISLIVYFKNKRYNF